MDTMQASLARAQISARLGEAQQRRLGHQVARAHRVSRKATRAAQAGRMALVQAH